MAGTSKIAAQAEYDAGAQLIILKEWPRAIQVLERFRTNNPKSEFTADVTRKLAVAYGETGQAGQAAVEFERIAMNPAESKDIQREANLQAADLYAKAGNTPKAVGMLERFVVTYPTPVADSDRGAPEARRHRGTAGNIDKQRYWQREIVNADRTAGAGRTDRTQYLAAKSQLALASPARDEFRNIPLVLPLKASASRRSARPWKPRSARYKAAADYRVAEVTTLATYEIAEIYRKLGQDIMKSERPKKLAARPARRIQLAARRAGLPVRRAGDLDARDQHQARARRRLRRRREEELRRAGRAQARPLRQDRDDECVVRCAGAAAAARAGAGTAVIATPADPDREAGGRRAAAAPRRRRRRSNDSEAAGARQHANSRARSR